MNARFGLAHAAPNRLPALVRAVGGGTAEAAGLISPAVGLFHGSHVGVAPVEAAMLPDDALRRRVRGGPGGTRGPQA